MPTYEYECTKCGTVVEIMQPITAPAKRKPDEPCKGCNQRAPIRRRIGTGGAILFKGSGFYETDYRSESYKKAAEAEKKSRSGESKSDGKSDAKSKSDSTEGNKAKSDTKKDKSGGKDASNRAAGVA